MGRKNWLFADTPKGARTSAVVYSIVETANANGFDVFGVSNVNAHAGQRLFELPGITWGINAMVSTTLGFIQEKS